ncbi:hypothetical protein ACFFGH_32705 [Lysobacter korlensis]|uniref:Metallo-beta-lactamase domain-containing protein n=1 Tax=Lysobacter korlensis TaxID=553636 RepID=A0ABV6S051_9GAMM
MSELVVRAYNVGFGDAVLVSIPERNGGRGETIRHLLIDVGNLLTGAANADAVFLDVVQDIIDRTGGEVDLYVMTHEHLDHAQGLLSAFRKGIKLGARYAWLTGSAHPEYYERNPQARKRKLETERTLEDAGRALEAAPDPELELLLRNNSPLHASGKLGLTTGDYIDHLRTLAPADRTHYVDRATAIGRKHPFREAKLRILAPEPDTTTYYGRSFRGGTLTAHADQPAQPRTGRGNVPELHEPPAGVDPGAYFDLLRSRASGLRANLLEIDAANNNTSIVLQIEWRGWRLLFPGDAELKSWRTMNTLGLLQPVHLIKVAHHGSHNGTFEELFDRLLPPQTPDDRDRFALISTSDGSWESVPDEETLDFYRSRCTLLDTRTVPRGEAIEVVLPG